MKHSLIQLASVVPFTYLEPFPIDTLPITDADGATKHSLDTVGPTPSTATKRVDGTSFSVYLVISIPLPALSNADLEVDKKNRSKSANL